MKSVAALLETAPEILYYFIFAARIRVGLKKQVSNRFFVCHMSPSDNNNYRSLIITYLATYRVCQKKNNPQDFFVLCPQFSLEFNTNGIKLKLSKFPFIKGIKNKNRTSSSQDIGHQVKNQFFPIYRLQL